ncbi:hypothetical protein [Actinomycetospora cinnamomea]|uniref:Uncharacterized protein n=1 Tax=Actinomycetospora cinnamomea TaxID=663609 RepID=A0A2U1FRU9_9PSEU|nr:hypothetical protein [Actinomycetospora cinnamomea]PVZ14931.1 hypothetical protein C8D89_101799 [Actinomycetospora cinnamomea]
MPKLPCPHRHPGRATRAAREPDELEHCDGLMVLVLDPVTGAADTYGPYPAGRARAEADGRRQELDAEDLTDVTVALVRHHRPR